MFTVYLSFLSNLNNLEALPLNFINNAIKTNSDLHWSWPKHNICPILVFNAKIYPGLSLRNMSFCTLSDVATPYSKRATPYTIGLWRNSDSKWLPVDIFLSPKSRFTKIVRCRSVQHHTFPTMWPGFPSISFIVRCRYIGQRAVCFDPLIDRHHFWHGCRFICLPSFSLWHLHNESANSSW